MKLSQSYVLVVNQESEDLHVLESLLGHMSCRMVVACSTDQVVARVKQAPPYLMILVGGDRHWSQPLIDQLRQIPQVNSVTIVALTDVNAPSWLHQEENPGLDGFLVKPLSGDVLTSLVQSAWARQVCFSMG